MHEHSANSVTEPAKQFETDQGPNPKEACKAYFDCIKQGKKEWIVNILDVLVSAIDGRNSGVTVFLVITFVVFVQFQFRSLVTAHGPIASLIAPESGLARMRSYVLALSRRITDRFPEGTRNGFQRDPIARQSRTNLYGSADAYAQERPT